MGKGLELLFLSADDYSILLRLGVQFLLEVLEFGVVLNHDGVCFVQTAGVLLLPLVQDACQSLRLRGEGLEGLFGVLELLGQTGDFVVEGLVVGEEFVDFPEGPLIFVR